MDRSEKLREYIENNPGTTEYAIARYAVKEKICARGTVHNLLYNILIPKGKIVDRKEGNSFHQFYINDQSDFNILIDRMGRLRRSLEKLEAFVQKNIEKIKKDSRLRNLAHIAYLNFYVMTSHIARETSRRIKSVQDREILYLRLAEMMEMTHALMRFLSFSHIIAADNLANTVWLQRKGLKKGLSSRQFVELSRLMTEF